MVENAKTLWGFVLYLQTCLLVMGGTYLYSRMAPRPLAPVNGDTTEAQMFWGFVMFICCVIYLRVCIWPPLHRLSRDCMHPKAFFAFSKRMALSALPFAPVLAVLVSVLVSDPPRWVFIPLGMGVAGLVMYLSSWNTRPISRAVDALLGTNPASAA
jgi:hypothetical protein